MTIVCGCGRKVETQPDWAGQWITCPGCNGSLYAPFPGPKPSTPTAIPGPTRLCPFCQETIPVADVKCTFCAAAVPPTRPIPVGPPPADVRPAPQVGDGGMASLLVSLIGYMFCGLLCPIGWMLGSKYEAECRRQGVEPAGAGKAGKIIGIIGTLFLLLSIGAFVLMAVLA